MAEVLVAGSTGGREHSIGDVLAYDGHLISFSHGNAGTAGVGRNFGIDSDNRIVDCATADLIVIVPEAPLAKGEADKLRHLGFDVFGPGADGARLEASKAFATSFMRRAGIPHPKSFVATTPGDADRYLTEHLPNDYVIKADGLAGGKGVILPESQIEAEDTVAGMMKGTLFDGAGRTIVFQERLSGPEFSAYLITDGRKFVTLPFVQDHKRRDDGDKGPNTGGMGAYSPIPFASPKLVNQIREIGDRTMAGLKKQGIDYRGVLFVGGMVDDQTDQASVLEYNVRFGDPETQVLMTIMQEAGIDIFSLLYSAARGHLEPGFPDLTRELGQAAMTVCLTAAGYPANPRKGDVVYGLNESYEGVTIHHGGTKMEDGRVVVAGGRVLYLTARGSNIDEAAARAYAAIDQGYHNNGVYFQGMHYRTDIAHQARRTV